MKIARVQAGDSVFYGVVEGGFIRRIEGELFGEYTVTDRKSVV